MMKSTSLLASVNRQLLCLSGPRVLLGQRCPFIKEEIRTSQDDDDSCVKPLSHPPFLPLPPTPSSCSLCTHTSGEPSDFYKVSFSDPSRDHYLRCLLGECDLLAFCSLCRATVKRLFHLREEVEVIEAKIRTVAKLGKLGLPFDSTQEKIQIQTESLHEDFEVQGSNNFFVKEEPSSSDDDNDYEKGEVKLEPCPTATGLGSSLDFGHHRRGQKPEHHECHICGQVFISQRELSRHTNTTHRHDNKQERGRRAEGDKKRSIPEYQVEGGGKVYGCPECGSTFSSKSNAITHLGRIHGVHISLQKSCPVCSKVFMRDDLLSAHSHPDPKDPRKEANTCSLCGNTYENVSGLRNHRIKMHEAAFRGVCHHCGKVFHTPACLKSHIGTCPLGNKEDQRTCPSCGKVFRSGAERLEHERVVHQGSTSNRCYFCSKILLCAWSLPVHLRAHTKERPFQCPKCGKKFSLGSSCRRHMIRVCRLKGKGCGEMRIEGPEAPRVRARSDPRHECPSCGGVFKQKRGLRAHTKKMHPRPTVHVRMDSKPEIPFFKEGGGGGKVFCCPQCGNKFVHKKSVFIHMAGVHGVKVARRKFCPVCSKAFRSLEVFMAHTHPDKRDPRKVLYNCPMCPKSVKTVGDLRGHKMRFHSGRTKCYFCSNTLLGGGGLAVHLRTHTLERPYACEKCGKDFKTQGGFKEHMVTACGGDQKKAEERRKQRRESERRLRAKLLHPCGACERRFGTRRELIQHKCVNKE